MRRTECCIIVGGHRLSYPAAPPSGNYSITLWYCVQDCMRTVNMLQIRAGRGKALLITPRYVTSRPKT